jgi:ribosomal protein S18 acetylase RimI-like enzyme
VNTDPVRTAADLVARIPRVAEFVSSTVPPTAACEGVVVADAEVAVWRWRHERTPWLHVTGPRPGAALTAALEVAGRWAEAEGVTVERQLIEGMPPRWELHEPESWDWWSLRAPPPRRPGEDVVEALGERDHAELRRLLDRASPSHWAPPGHPRVTAWWGVRDPDGRLVACVCNAPAVPEVPHLASVATDPDHRGRGLARDLVARAARDLLDAGAGVVTLGSYADNDVAARAYRALGFAIRFRWTSARLSPR